MSGKLVVTIAKLPFFMFSPHEGGGEAHPQEQCDLSQSGHEQLPKSVVDEAWAVLRQRL
jgi:hypothetical protein